MARHAVVMPMHVTVTHALGHLAKAGNDELRVVDDGGAYRGTLERSALLGVQDPQGHSLASLLHHCKPRWAPSDGLLP